MYQEHQDELEVEQKLSDKQIPSKKRGNMNERMRSSGKYCQLLHREDQVLLINDFIHKSNCSINVWTNEWMREQKREERETSATHTDSKCGVWDSTSI